MICADDKNECFPKARAFHLFLRNYVCNFVKDVAASAKSNKCLSFSSICKTFPMSANVICMLLKDGFTSRVRNSKNACLRDTE